MGALRTIIVSLALVLGVSAPAAAQSLPSSPTERLHLFAACAGRLTAEIQHAWLVDPAAADPLEPQRDGFADLTEALLPLAEDAGLPAGQALNWRVQDWAVQRALLDAARFATDPKRAERARLRAAARRAECDGLLLG